MTRTRSALARHRQRRLQEATLHVSESADLDAVAEIAGAVSLARLREDDDADDAPEDAPSRDPARAVQCAIRVLRNVKNSVYHRAMAARALGLLMLDDPSLLTRLGLEREELLDALLQLVNCCRRVETHSGDTRRVHVNCCLVISLLMRAAQQAHQQHVPQQLQLVVPLDSELLAMPPRPVDRVSAFLMLTVSGRPESSADDHVAANGLNGMSEKDRLPLQPLRSAARTRPVQPMVPPIDPASSPQRVKGMQSSSSPVKTKAIALNRRMEHSTPPPPPSGSMHRDEDVALAPVIERRQTPNRQFKMERFRVVTPALVPSSPSGVERVRSKALPVIPPSRHLMRPDVESPTGAASNQLSSSPRGHVPPPEPSSLVLPASSTLLPPHHMVEILRSGRMPVSSAGYFHAHLRDGDATVRRTDTPSRIQVVEWGEWRRRELGGGDNPTSHVNENNETIALASPQPQPPTGDPAPRASMRARRSLIENIHTPEYKRERLREILSSPIEPLNRNTAQLVALDHRESTTTMQALHAELCDLRDSEARTRQQLRTRIEQERDKLPLKFLFQLPGGAAYCRDRMRRAMLLWVLEFEANQKRMALLQWKAVVEQWRFRQRSEAYHRLAIEKRLKVAIAYVVRGFQQQAFRKWVETVQLAIWSDRDTAVRKIQRQVRRRFGLVRLVRWHDAHPVGGPRLRDIYLTGPREEDIVPFRIPNRVRHERRRIWFAAELVQGVYRKRRFRRFLKRYRVAATKIQARARMRIHRGRYRLIRRRIICFQAWVRMHHHYRIYQTLRQAAILVQVNFRTMRIKRMRNLVVKAQRRAVEWRLTATLYLQRIARGFLGRCEARRRRRECDEMFHAALVVQRAWYRRNNEWSTFLLLGCLREQEMEDIAFDKRVLRFKQEYMAKQIQRAWCRYRHGVRSEAATIAQRNVRRWIATRLVNRMRLELLSHRRIKWFFRFRHAHRITTARKLQYWWLRAVPYRLTAHFHNRRLVSEAAMRQQTYFCREHAAARIQSIARGRCDRLLARQERSARVIQRAAREFIVWRRVKREIRRIKVLFAAQQAQQWLADGIHVVFTATMARLDRAATHIQRLARGYLWRTRLVRLIVESELRERMASRIQLRWRQNAQSRVAQRVLSAQRRRRDNPFRDIDSIACLLRATRERAEVYYDPDDEIRGVHVAEWLKRLGLNEELYVPMFQKLVDETGKDALCQLRDSGSPDQCLRLLERIGVNDEDAELMTINLFAAKTLHDVRCLRSQLETLRRGHKEEEKRTAFALQQLHHAQHAKQEVADELEDVLSEAAEFRNPPKALRDKREKLSSQLKVVQKHLATIKHRHEMIEKRIAQHKRETQRLQNELSGRERDEISALYSLQNFRLVSQLSVARELFLSKFPGLEARALAFVGALEEGQISTWQLLKFFQTNVTISQVKASMPLLTYFKYATDVKKHDHSRFQACSDILQYGMERMCELLNVPVDEVVLRTHGGQDENIRNRWLLPIMTLRTIYEAHRCRAPRDRASVWVKGVQALSQMSSVATRVQSHWRRRAASRVMLMLRSARLKQQLRDEYLAEVRADYVTPIWQQERDREKEEFEQWLHDEELAAREEALRAILRHPWREKWDEATQAWVIYRVHYGSRSGENDEHSGEYYEYSAERPVYSVEEEDAVIRIQSIARRYIARSELHERRRQQRRDDKRRSMERQWMTKTAERTQTLTLRLQVGVAADERVSLWLGHRQHQQQHKIKEQKDAMARLTSGKHSKTTSIPTTQTSPSPRRRRNATEKEDQEKRNVRNAEIVSAFEARLSSAAVLQQCEATYHRSVRAEHRRQVLFPVNARPPNAHAQATLDFLHATQTLQRSLALTSRAAASLTYTRAALPFGWREVSPSSPDEQVYYFNTNTQETAWERPQYGFDAEYAAIKIQSLARVAVAWAERARTLDEISFAATIHSTIQDAARVGWVGFGLEGMSAASFLSRLGLGKYATSGAPLASLSVNDVLRLSEAKMKKLGMSKEEISILKTHAPPRVKRTTRTFPLSNCLLALAPTVKHAFNVLPSDRVVHQIVAQSLPNQQGRVVGLVRAVIQSSTPISYRQLEMHLRLYAGRPDDAVTHIGDIASLAYATQAPQERQILELFLRCLERCIVFAANLQLRGLHEELSIVARAAAALLDDKGNKLEHRHDDDGLSTHENLKSSQQTKDESKTMQTTRVLVSCATPLARSDKANDARLVASLADTMRRRCVERPAKGLWEHDAQSPGPLSAAQVALFVREHGLERVLSWWRSAALTQATFRMHRVRAWYRLVLAHRRSCAIQIQSTWRVFCAREARRLLESQQRSPYEQQYDKLTKTFFFLYTPTREKLLEEPQDAQGVMLPYRPMVQDRVTKRWMLAWPHLQTKERKPKLTDPDNDEDDDWTRDAPRCSLCHVERAVRRCLECVATSGDYIDSCLACFFDRHDPAGELAWHTFTPLHALRQDRPRAFHCVECKRFSTVRCLACREHYCERCFLRVHRKGHTRAHHTCEHYAAGAAICAECEANIAFQKCLVCLDSLCEPCMARTHARGAKQSHARDLLRQPLDPDSGYVYCEHCDARRGDATCSYCARALCHVCLADPAKHATAACPETLLQIKKRELLGDRLCVECGKPADRQCDRCGDKYCSVKWMGNPGCFERFHLKGKRADHTCVPLEPDLAGAASKSELAREILELEEKVKQKRRRDAEAAEQEARAMAAALAEAAAEAEAKRAADSSDSRKRRVRRGAAGASKRRLLGSANARLVCGVDGCGRPTVSAAVPFCSSHLTSQHALEVTKQDPLEAAKLLALVDKHGGTLPVVRTDRGWRISWRAQKAAAPATHDRTSSQKAAANKKTKKVTKKIEEQNEVGVAPSDM